MKVRNVEQQPRCAFCPLAPADLVIEYEHGTLALCSCCAKDLEGALLRRASTGAQLIAEERERQITNWSSDHDDSHDGGELAKVAAGLAAHGAGAAVVDTEGWSSEEDRWGLIAKHGANYKRCLVIAGALIAAEIDRVDRLP